MSGSRKTAAQAIRDLGDWAARMPASAIPREVLARGVRVLADDLAAIIGARDEPEVAAFHERVLGRARAAEATVYRGGRRRTDRVSAAVANAVAADWLELDEGYRMAPCHAGLYVLPALLAEAEACNLAFSEMLRSLVLGYEIVTRVARAWPPRAMNMHSHAVIPRSARRGVCARARRLRAARRALGHGVYAHRALAAQPPCRGIPRAMSGPRRAHGRFNGGRMGRVRHCRCARCVS